MGIKVRESESLADKGLLGSFGNNCDGEIREQKDSSEK